MRVEPANDARCAPRIAQDFRMDCGGIEGQLPHVAVARGLG
jgi:hypothetical protein